MTAEAKAATAAAKSWEQATLLINGKKVEWGTSPLLFRGEENIVTVEASDEIARELNLGLPEDGGLNIVASPTFGSWVARVNGKFEWKIKPDADKSGRITLVFYSREVLESWEHRSLVISSNLAEEVTVLLNGNVIPTRGANFIGGQSNVLTLEYKSADFLVGAPLAIDVSPQSGLVTGDFSCVPALRQLTTKHEWTLTGAPLKSGTFKVKLLSEGEKASLLTPTHRLSREVFRFVDLLDYELNLPPELIVLPANFLLVFRARLLNSAGVPLGSVPVTFTAPEHETFDNETDHRGIAVSAAYLFKTPGERVIKAIAELPTGVSSIEVLVRIGGGES